MASLTIRDGVSSKDLIKTSNEGKVKMMMSEKLGEMMGLKIKPAKRITFKA